MSSRFRLTLLLVSAPLVLLVVIGGFLSKASARGDDSLRHLRVFEDVMRLVLQNYVENVNSDHIMTGRDAGARRGPRPRQRVPDAGAGRELREAATRSRRGRSASS